MCTLLSMMEGYMLLGQPKPDAKIVEKIGILRLLVAPILAINPETSVIHNQKYFSILVFHQGS